MKFIEKSCNQFVTELASSAPVPGGGGASALVGAHGIALGMKVGNLAIGKPSYADVQKELLRLLEEAETVKEELLALVDKDAVMFEPLAKAYAIPKDDPSRAQVMEDALRSACVVPMEIMRLCARGIELCDEFALKGSRLALSDAGVGAACCKAALQGASLNIFINAKYMDNRAFAKKLEAETDAMLEKYCDKANEIFNSVSDKLRGV